MTTKTLSQGTVARTGRVARGLPKRTEPAKPTPDLSRVANREWYPGLCASCATDPVCIFPRSVDHPVLTCDEFDGAVEVKPTVAVQSKRFDERFAVANREWFPGLCMTCEKRETCSFPKPEGGVFNCDEFE